MPVNQTESGRRPSIADYGTRRLVVDYSKFLVGREVNWRWRVQLISEMAYLILLGYEYCV